SQRNRGVRPASRAKAEAATPRRRSSASRQQPAAGSSAGFKESLDVLEFGGHWSRRQRRKKSAAVRHRTQPRIEYGEDAAVLSMPQQPSETLLQRQDGERNLVFPECGSAACVDRVDARRRDGIAGGGKGQLFDDDGAQGLSDDIDPLPEAGRGEQHGVRRRFEVTKQRRPRRGSLDRDRRLDPRRRRPT